MKIAVAGMGYVGLFLVMLLAQHNDVRIFDVVPEKVALLNQGKSSMRMKRSIAFCASVAKELFS